MAGLKAFYMGSARSAALEGCLNASRERGVSRSTLRKISRINCRVSVTPKRAAPT